MAKKVIWSKRAITSFDRVIAYLKEDWTEKEILKFVNQTNKILGLIQSDFVKFKRSGKVDLYEVLITKHNLLIYRDNSDRIELLVFYDTRQNPKKKKL